MKRDSEELKNNSLYFLKKLSTGIKKDTIEIHTVETNVETDRACIDGVSWDYLPTGFETITIRYLRKESVDE